MATENDSDIFANTESRLVLDNYCSVVIANLKPNSLFFRTHYLWYERRWSLKKNGEKLSNPNLLLLYLQFLSHVLESLSFCL